MREIKKITLLTMVILAIVMLMGISCYAAGNGAGNESNQGFAVSDGTYVYYSADGNLYRENIGGGSKKTLIEETSAISSIVPDGDYLYYFCGQSISKIKKDGSNKKFVTYAGGIAVPPNTYIKDGYVYYSTVNSFGTSTIHKLNLNSGDDKKIATSSESFAVSGNKIYFSNDDSNDGAKGLASIDLNGGSFKTYNEGTAVSINVYDGSIYYTKDNKIWKIQTSGGDAKILCNANTTYINVYKDYIYFRENGKLTRISTGGGEKKTSNLSINSIICICEDKIYGRSTDNYKSVEIYDIPSFDSSNGEEANVSLGDSASNSGSNHNSSGSNKSNVGSTGGITSSGSTSVGGSSSGNSSGSSSSNGGSSSSNSPSSNKIVNTSDYWDLSSSDDCFDEVNILSEIDVISGFEDGSFKPNQPVTRAQMAKLVVEALDESNYARTSRSNSRFYDVSANHWAKGYINQGVSDGFIAGYSDTYFGPEDGVTYMQAMKMLVSAIGYETYSQSYGGWPEGYRQWGNKLGIGDGVYAGDDTQLNRGQVAIMLYNAMNAPICVIKSYSTTGDGRTIANLEAKDGTGADFQNLFTKCHSIYKVSGYLKSIDAFIITYADNYNDKYYPIGSSDNIRITTTYGWDHGSQVILNKYGTDFINVACTAFIKLNPMTGTNIIYMTK